MTAFQRLIRRKTVLAILLTAGLGVASNTYAGFEWVPQKKTSPSPSIEMPSNSPAIINEPIAVDDVVLPLPSDEALNEPVIVVPAAPVETHNHSAPTRIAITPKEEPNTGAYTSNPVETSLPPLNVIDTQEPQAIPEDTAEMLKQPPIDKSNINIIVPDDAPASALETIKNETTISAYPSQKDLDATRETPMPTSINENSPAAVISSEFSEAVGFAKDVPLALALRQVVPADYAFSFATGVNPGLRVSWNGGKPWNDVVSDMTAPLGYGVVITDKSVRITQQQQTEAIISPNLVEPAAGNDDLNGEITTSVNRARDIKRVGISDPGSAEVNVKNIEDISPIVIGKPIASVDETEIEMASNSPVQAEDAAPSKITFWTAKAGSSLKDTLAQWSDTAEVDLVWDASHDFQLPADFEVQGSFEKAVNLLLKHGLDKQNAALLHTLATSSQNEQAQIIIQNAA